LKKFRGKRVFIVEPKKRYVANYAESVGDKSEFMSVAEMPVDILLTDERIGF
jgi:hypothetical protein